jgi:hypothetical protein
VRKDSFCSNVLDVFFFRFVGYFITKSTKGNFLLPFITKERYQNSILKLRCFDIMGGHGKFAFNLVVKLSVQLSYVFLNLRL